MEHTAGQDTKSEYQEIEISVAWPICIKKTLKACM